VQEKLKEMSLEPKAMLLLYNCSAHPNEEQLISTDGKVLPSSSLPMLYL